MPSSKENAVFFSISKKLSHHRMTKSATFNLSKYYVFVLENLNHLDSALTKMSDYKDNYNDIINISNLVSLACSST